MSIIDPGQPSYGMLMVRFYNFLITMIRSLVARL